MGRAIVIPYYADMSRSILEMCEELIKIARNESVEKFVVGTAILKDEALLIVFRSDDEDFLPGYAEIPGGGVEEGESLLDALRRETTEETGLEIAEFIGYTGGFDYLSGSGKKTRQFNFLVKPISYEITLNPAEHTRYIWLPLKDNPQMKQLHMTHEIRHSIEEVRSFRLSA